MQLLGVDHTNFHRNRLTHSLEVAQIAESIATNLGLENPVVSETCSLCHDMGNPPFGHAGEKILNELAEDIGGYEGNAQTFRILHRLEKKHYAFAGLNLTVRTLLGVTKYFYRKGENPDKPNKFLYNDDYHFLYREIKDKQIDIKKSIDAQIMDLADEIAYAAHDLEDAISFGFITLSEMMYEFDIDEEFKSIRDVFKNEIATPARIVALKGRENNRLNTSEEYSFILRKELTSNIVHILMNDIGLVDKDGSKQLGYKNKNFIKLAEGLKKLVFKALLRKKDIQLYEKQGERIIRGLFEVYSDSKFNKDLLLLPPELRAITKNVSDDYSIIKRVIIDYIAGMMDSFAMQEYKRYFGSSSLDMIYDRNLWSNQF
ncbi:deoxyguanosinetriphosphate triphosphohydrolase [Geminocystis sp. NIES-3708]|nr:deoxyguanosinetriphosphate triphosphohydrolase [Geminocystis sp. NIES-3708]